eukprot:5431305-Pyramimonas_sp.AAC.1
MLARRAGPRRFGYLQASRQMGPRATTGSRSRFRFCTDGGSVGLGGFLRRSRQNLLSGAALETPRADVSGIAPHA